MKNGSLNLTLSLVIFLVSSAVYARATHRSTLEEPAAAKNKEQSLGFDSKGEKPEEIALPEDLLGVVSEYLEAASDRSNFFNTCSKMKNAPNNENWNKKKA